MQVLKPLSSFYCCFTAGEIHPLYLVWGLLPPGRKMRWEIQNVTIVTRTSKELKTFSTRSYNNCLWRDAFSLPVVSPGQEVKQDLSS